MNTVFGIHVGNSTACLSIYKQDESKSCVEVIANNAGERVTPALVTLTESEYVVGTACKSLLISRWNATVTCNKRSLLMESVESPSNGERKVAMVMRGGELCYEIPLESRTHFTSPANIASRIYRYLYEIARSAVPGEEGDISCVLLVPNHFTEIGRFKIWAAAQDVGWNVLHVITEPAAAVLGYNMLSEKTPPPNQTVLVYKVGGRSCDATVIDLKYGMITILDTEHSDAIGGKVLITALAKFLADSYYSKYRLDPKESHRAYIKLTQAAENCLHVLSTIESANCFVESLCEGVDFSQSVSRARFESLVVPFLEKFTRPIYTVLDRLEMKPDNINTVLLCGGPLKIPRLKKHLTDIFNENNTKVMPLPNGINYDEVLACGAAQQAGSIASERMDDDFLPSNISISVLEFAIVVQVEGAKCEDIMFEPAYPLPVHKTVSISSPEATVTITFTQVNSPNILMKGEVQLENLENPTEMTLEIDRHQCNKLKVQSIQKMWNLFLNAGSESGIKLGVPESEGALRYHTIKMYSYTI